MATVDIATASAEQLEQLAATLPATERSNLQKALQLLADENSVDCVTQEELDSARVALCLTEEFVLDDKPRQVFLNGDKLFVARPADEEVRKQIGELEYVELAEERPVQALKTLVEWIGSGFPGYVKILGAVVNSRDVPLKERKVIGLIYEMTSDTLESYLHKNEDLRNDHKMYLAMTVFQAWSHTLYFGPCLRVFTMENIVVTRNEDSPSRSYDGYRAQLRLQFPTSSYEKAMCIETLDTNVEQLADVLWFACHCDSGKLQEMPRVEKPVDGEKVLKFTCRNFLKSLYEHKSKCQTKPENIVRKMQQEFGHVRECFAGLD